MKNVTTLEPMEVPALYGEWFKNLIETQAYPIEINRERASSYEGQKQIFVIRWRISDCQDYKAKLNAYSSSMQRFSALQTR